MGNTLNAPGQSGALGQSGGYSLNGQQQNPLIPTGAQALALMQLLLPKSHTFVPVDYDPFEESDDQK